MIIVDTGPLYAAVDRRDAHHEECSEFFETDDGPLVVPVSVLIECSYLIETHIGPTEEAKFLLSSQDGSFQVEDLTSADLKRMAGLVEKYSDLPLGAVDASVIAVAERLGVTDIATLDHRHFTVVRPGHADAFTLLP